MKPLVFLTATLLWIAATARGGVATSENYTMAAFSVEGGGAESASVNYSQRVAVQDIAGRTVAIQSDEVFFGFAAQLNNPPIPANDLRTHPADEPGTLPVAGLLANDADPDNDPLRIFKWDTFSEKGGSIVATESALVYRPPAGLEGEDRFTYTVIDPAGDIATATVTMLIAPSIEEQPLNSVRLYPLSDGKYLFRLKGIPAMDQYEIQFAPDLRLRRWETVGVFDGPDGVIQFVIDPTLTPQGYYRAISRNL